MTTTKIPQKNYITTEHRYLSALHDIQASGVLVFDNYPSCCGTCSDAEITRDYPDTDHVFFVGSQGRALKFTEGVPINFDEDDDDKPATTIYWSHSTLKAAQAAYDAFMRHGFTVDWDGTITRCVVVRF